MNKFRWFGSERPFNRRFAVYLPSLDRDGNRTAMFDRLAEATADVLCDLFGGVTTYAATGQFRRETGIALRETIAVQECFCENQAWERNSAFVHGLVGVLCRLLDQESIACSLDGDMVFVPPGEFGFDLADPIDREVLSAWAKSRAASPGDSDNI